MPYADLREYINRLEEKGELKRIKKEVDWNLELGAIMRRANDLREPSLQNFKLNQVLWSYVGAVDRTDGTGDRVATF